MTTDMHTPARDMTPPADSDVTPDPFPGLRAVALIAAPVLLTAGSALHPDGGTGPAGVLTAAAEHPTQWWASHLLLLLGAACFVPAATALRTRTEDHTPGRARLGSLLTAVGALAVLAIVAVETTAGWALARSADTTSAVAALEDVEVGATLAFGLPMLAFHLGLLALASGLRRVPGTRAFQPAAVALGSVALLVGQMMVAPVVIVVACALLVVGLVPVGLRLRHDARSAA